MAINYQIKGKNNITIKYILFILTLFYFRTVKAQFTAIPDPIFEQFLIDNGFDSDLTINGQVLTSDIELITFLEINETPPIYAINDFTGIQDFTSLEGIRFNVTNATFIDFGNLTNLIDIEGISNTNLEFIDISGCENLETFIMSSTNLNTIVLPLTTTLEVFSCTNGMLTNLDLSFYSALTSISVGDNQLQSLNVANGNNTNVTFFSSTGNSDLTCIIVDDVTYSEVNWTFIDPTTTFVASQEECDELSVDQFNLFDFSVYPNPTTDFFYLETDTQIYKIDVFNLNGKIVKSFNSNQNIYPVNELSKGIYIINIMSSLGKSTQKLIID